MSEIKVDTVAEKTSANGVTIDGLSIKDSKLVTANSVVETNLTNDIVTLAKMAAGTDGNIISYDASGNPVAIATGNDGQVLTSTGAGSPPAFEAIPAGGITVADMWRITADKSVNNSSNVIDSNLEQCDTGIQGTLGSAMSVSSGLFTFPSTGIWLILGNFKWNNASNNNSEYCQIKHETTSNNGSSYTDSAYTFAYFNSLSSQLYANSTSMEMLDITNTSTHKIRFTAASAQNSLLGGSTDHNTSTFTFIRMGDT